MAVNQIVLQKVIRAVAIIEASPKNATAALREEACGGLLMAWELGAITTPQYESARMYVRTAASWRGVRNFPNMEKWYDQFVEARERYFDVWARGVEKLAKQSTGAASQTPDLLTQKLGRGRPRNSSSMTAAERQAKFRAGRVAIKLGERMSATVRGYATDFDLTENEVLVELVRFALTNRNWKETGF